MVVEMQVHNNWCKLSVMTTRCWNCGKALAVGARVCPACGVAAGPEQAGVRSGLVDAGRALVGERKQVTVLFADFAGFTAFSEKRDIEEVHDYMNSLWSRLDAIISNHGGSIEKHIGDAIMSVFGA